MTPTVACIGHQELRDMVIELRTDVKHIDGKISNLVEIAKTNSNRINTLETINDQAVGEARGVRNSAAFTSVVISVVVSVVAIAVSVVFR